MFESIIKDVPDYKRFYTVDELNTSSDELVRKYPTKVEIFDAGKSRNGEDIKVLKVGDGSKAALFFGFPHPNEPIGSMTLEYLSRKLLEDDGLSQLDFTWYIIKCIDPDGARLNEEWFYGPFTPLNYALNHYRPPGDQQVEWTFPVKYKTLVWNKPLPETRALIRIIKNVKPKFMCSLHNSGFGGAYFYVSSPCKPLYAKLQKSVKKENLPLHLGEPEAPYVRKLADAVFQIPNTAKIYEFMKKHMNTDPAKILNYGASSSDYAKRLAGTFTFACELPYFYDSRIENTSESDVTKKEAILYSLDLAEKRYRFIRQKYLEAGDMKRLGGKRPLINVVVDYLKHFPNDIVSQRHWAETDSGLKRKATVAEKFVCYALSRFGGLLQLGMLYRCLKETPNDKVKKEVLEYINEWNGELEKQLSYKVIPIRVLVRAQAKTALYTSRYVLKRH